MFIVIFAYLTGSLFVAFIGKNSRIGFLPTFVASILFSPFVILLGLLLFSNVLDRKLSN